LFAACGSIRSFFDTLTNWYIRRSRNRFWDGDSAAFDVLYTVLTTLCRVAAPLLPLTTEAVFQGLVASAGGSADESVSVHLTDWPLSSEFPAVDTLVTSMDRVRDVCSAASAVRKASDRRVRQPLATLTIAAHDAHELADYTSIITDEMNVKAVVLATDPAQYVTSVHQPVPATIGKLRGKQTQKVIQAVKAGAIETANGLTVVVDGETLLLDVSEYTSRLVPAEGQSVAVLPGPVGTAGVVLLDINLTPELEAEGLARDAVRAIQQARRDAKLHVSDRIALTLASSDESVRSAMVTHQSLISEEVLAVSFAVTTDAPVGAHTTSATVGDDLALSVSLTKAE
jgi:isoleucyl-tRNA synthetase